MFKTIGYYTEKKIKSFFTEIYKLKIDKIGVFLQFWWFLRILTILGVAPHVQLGNICSKNYSTTQYSSLAIIIEHCKVRDTPQASGSRLQLFIFSVFQFCLEALLQTALSQRRKKIIEIWTPSFESSINLLQMQNGSILSQIASFEAKIGTEKHYFSQKSVKIFPRLMTS